MRIQPIILAAGRGTRMGNPDLPKVLQPINGRPMVSYVLDAFSHTAFLPPVLVVGYHHQLVRDTYGSTYRYILQEEQKGTGHAIRICRPELEGTAEAYLIVCGDQPLLKAESMGRLAESHAASEAKVSMASVVSDHPSFEGFGRVLRSAEGKILGIREYKDCSEEEKHLHEFNPSLYCFNDDWMWHALEKVKPLNNQGEYYITDLIGMAVEQNLDIDSFILPDWHEALGVNTPEQLEEVSRVLSQSSL